MILPCNTFIVLLSDSTLDISVIPSGSHFVLLFLTLPGSTYRLLRGCPKSSWTSLVEVLDKHICLKAFVFPKVQHQLNKWSKFHENYFSCFGVTPS